MGEAERGSQWPELWPARLGKPPYWLQSSEVGVYGKPQPEDFAVDYEHWKRVVTKSYVNGLGINWSTVRNVMDMRAVYGGYNFFFDIYFGLFYFLLFWSWFCAFPADLLLL